MTLTNWITDRMFGCWHPNTSRVFSDREGEYIRCLDCGRRISYDFASLGAVKDEFSQSLEQFGEIR